MEHHEAMRLIDMSASGKLSLAEQSALDEHLAACTTCRAYAAGLPALEAELRRKLRIRYPELGADEKATSAALGRISMRLRRQSMFRSIYRTAAWTALAALFVLSIGWSIRFLLPRPPATSGITGTPQGLTPPPATQQPTPVATLAPTSTSSASLGQSNALFPNVQFALDTELPAASEPVTLYVQQLPDPVSLERISQLAATLGLNAPIYQRPGEGTQPVYIVTDGFRMLTIPYDSAEVFLYVANNSEVLSNHGPALPSDQIVETATRFLKDSGLFEDTLLAGRLPHQSNSVSFTRTLEGRPVVFGVGRGPRHDLEVTLDAKGDVSQVNYFPMRAGPAGQYPILSAEQAWQAFLSGEAKDRLRYGISDPDTPWMLQTWQRGYPAGETVHDYGYASVLQPAEPGGLPLAMLNNWLVSGDNAAAFASQASPYNFTHAWGQFQADEQGRLAFRLEGWEVSPLEDQYFQGKIRRQGEQAWLVTDEGEFELPDLPPDVPEDVFTEARGVFASPGILDWSTINSGLAAGYGYSMFDACMGGGGGGGGNDFGGGTFRQVSLQPVQSKATPTPSVQVAPFQVGDGIEGAAGTVTVQQRIYTDGRNQLEFYFSGEPVGSFSGSWAAHLVGEGTQGLVELNSLPVRIWGRVTGLASDGWPEVEVERFEEVYPGLRFQAWLGKWQRVTLEGKEVLLLTTLEGDQFVLSTSIDYGASAAIGLEGDQVVIEGLAMPGKTFGGYPVITEYSGSMANDLTDLNSYEITSDKPRVFDESVGETAQAQQLTGQGTVEQVELVYATATLAGCRDMVLAENNLQSAPWLIVQPVWRFTGSFADGRTFEIQIQALAEEYLK